MMRQQTKHEKCVAAECAAQNALERLRRAGRKNKAAANSYLRKSPTQLRDDEPTLNMEDSGLHEIS